MSTQQPSASPDPDKDALINARDALIKAYNARYFRDLLSLEVARAERYKVPLSLLIGDIDKFKQVNDTFGSASGNKVLKAVIDIIQFSTRVTDVVCRIGGDKLAIILTHTERHGASRVCKHFERGLAERIRLPDDLRGVAVSMTFGLGEYQSPESSDAFILRVEQALNRAKKNGDDPDEGLLGVPVRF